MFNRYSVSTIASSLLLAIICNVTAAQEKQEKQEKLVFVIGIVKEIDCENGTITIVRKNKDGSTDEDTAMVSKQTKYFFVSSIKGLESGDGVILTCRGSKDEYDAVKVKRISNKRNDTYISVTGIVKIINYQDEIITIVNKKRDGSIREQSS